MRSMAGRGGIAPSAIVSSVDQEAVMGWQFMWHGVCLVRWHARAFPPDHPLRVRHGEPGAG
jgi:hypothetical protein